MSWTDKIATETILKLSDEFYIDCFVETGTFKGANAELHAHNFEEVHTVDINADYIKTANKRLKGYRNIKTYVMKSWDFLKLFINNYYVENRVDTIFFYLDAHFYNSLDKENKWVVLKELEVLKYFDNCLICIHDFKCSGLGHLVYDGEPLDWNLIKSLVGHKKYLYCNTKEYSYIYNKDTIKELPITIDNDVLDTLKYANSSEEKKYRGILYIVPKKLNLWNYKLSEYEH